MTASTTPKELQDVGTLIHQAFVEIAGHLDLLKRRLKFLLDFDGSSIGIPEAKELMANGWLRETFVDETKRVIENGVYCVLVVLHGKQAFGSSNTYGQPEAIDPKKDPGLSPLFEQARNHAASLDSTIKGKDSVEILKAQIAHVEPVKNALVRMWHLMNIKLHDNGTLEDLDPSSDE